MLEKKERHNKQHNLELLDNTALVEECFKKWQLNTSGSAFYVMVGYKTYWCAVDDTKLKINDSTIDLNTFTKHIALAEIANCSITILYSQVESGSEECIYYLEIAQSKTKKAKSAFTAKQLARACPHFALHQIIMHAKYVIDLKFLANLSNRVAILRKCFRRANIFSTKCLSL